MRPRDFTTVSYTFRLFDTRDQPVSNLLAELQYLESGSQQWEPFQQGRFANGVFFFEEPVNPGSDPPKSIFLQSDDIPELRLIATPSIYASTTKPEVLAFTCEVIPDPNAGTLAFDFGTAYLIEEAVLPSGDVFADFILVTSRISLVNQANNIRLIMSLQAENRAKDDEIEALTTEIEAKNTTIASLDSQLVTALSDVQQKTLEITRLEALQDDLEANVLALQQQVTILQEQLNIESRPVPVSTLYTQLVNEIDTSAQNSAGSGYQLANISLKLKTLITRDEDGVNAQLFDFSAMDQINGAAVSELVFDIAPSPPLPPRAGMMPNVLGLTETAVRKVLTSLGLRLNPVFQNNPQVVNGDSFKQSPAEGTTYNNNDFVTVIFSKHE